MVFSEIDFYGVKDYLVCDDEDIDEVEIYISAAKSYVTNYTGLTCSELDKYEYFTMPTLMLISSFYENKLVESNTKVNTIFTNLLNLNRDISL